MTTPLEDVLAGREERVALQKEFLAEKYFVCQIALNIPGYPKRLSGDEGAVEKCRAAFLQKYKPRPVRECYLANGAGFCWLGLFDGDKNDAETAKHAAVAVEEESDTGRIFDIDIITREGQISRASLALPPRKCLVCDKEAKICAKEQSHQIEELRTEIQKRLKN